MISSTINSIDSVLDYLALLKKIRSLKTGELKYFLTGLKAFLLCAKMLGADAQLRFDGSDSVVEGTLGSFLIRIDQEICRYEMTLQAYCGGRDDGTCAFEESNGDHEDLGMNLFYFQTLVISFVKEIDEWYTTFSDSLHLHESCFSTIDDVVEIIDSTFQNLVDLEGLDSDAASILLDQMEGMEEKIKLFGNFIRFVARLSVEHQRLENFVIHSATVAINAAHVTARAQHYYVLDIIQPELPGVLTVLRMIKPFDPQVFEVYRTALDSAKSSRELLHSPTLPLDRDFDSSIMKNCIDFLLWSLWETQLMNSSPIISIEHQLKLLWEGLKIFRTLLQEKTEEFDENIRDLSTTVICDAGVIIFSLYQSDAQINFGLPKFLKKFKMILAEVEKQVPETSIFNMPRFGFLGFLNHLLDSLMELKSSQVDSSTHSRIQTIRKDLTSILDVLVELQNQQGDLQCLWNHAIQVASKIKSFIDQLALGDIPDSFSTSLDSITQDITSFKDCALEISRGRKQEVDDKEKASTSLPPQNSPSATDEVVGFKEETKSVIQRLTGGSKKREVVSIVGMPGSGKTTLATDIYNHPTIRRHFSVRSRCSVSQVYKERILLLQLLNHFLPKVPDDNYLEMSEIDMVMKLRRFLKGRRYLLFLDGVWDIEVWNSLKKWLPDDSNGSRILLTSQLCQSVPGVMPDGTPHHLRQLTEAESWELLQKRIVFKNKGSQDLSELGKQIVVYCRGLPLMVVIVAGLLNTEEPEVWKQVLKNLSSDDISSTGQSYYALKLSYDHLPNHLKACFLYFGLFPKEQEVLFKLLVWLWSAEGFVHRTELESSEDVATSYIMDLVQRNLVIVPKKGSRGGVKVCCVHGVIHDFCKTKAREENFFQHLKGYGKILGFNEWHYHPRRISIHSRRRDFKQLRLFHPNVHSLQLFTHNEPWSGGVNDISVMISVFKNIRVLNMSQIDLGDVFPCEMERLDELRYLALKGRELTIPSFIGNFLNLEILIVDSTIVGTLPDTMWNLRELRHLCMPKGFRFSVENLDNSRGLHKLESCSTVIIDSWDISEKLMSKFPAVCKLKCRLSQTATMNCNKILISESLVDMKSLRVSMDEVDQEWPSVLPRELEHAQFEFNVPKNLTKLTLKGFELPQTGISAIGKLIKLQILKLLHVNFWEGNFNMMEGDFSSLRFLKLENSKLSRWTAPDESLPSLEKLVLKGCTNLVKIPSLECFKTLKFIDVLNSSESVESLVKQLQKDWACLNLKILLSPQV